MTDKMVENESGGVKGDGGKPRWSLLPWKQIGEIVKVLTKGAEKYNDDNWKKVEPERYKSAMFRHLAAWADGEKNDPEWGLSHLAHAGCCLLYLMWFDMRIKTSIGGGKIFYRTRNSISQDSCASTYENLNPGHDVKKFDKDESEARKQFKRRMEVADLLSSDADKELSDSSNPTCDSCVFEGCSALTVKCSSCYRSPGGRLPYWEPK